MPSPSPGSLHTALDYALAYARAGWPVIPINWIEADGRCSCGDDHNGAHMTPASRGKHPYKVFAPKGSHSATTDEARIRAWWTATPRLNIGIATGSGLGVVDIDPRNGGADVWDQLCAANNYTPRTLTAVTGGGGSHLLYRTPEGFRLKYLGKGVDVKNDGGLIIVAPSIHASGRAYAWECDEDFPDPGQIEDAPAWMLEPVSGSALGVVSISGGAIGHVPPEQLADLRSALACLDPDPRDTWRDVGAAMHSTSDPALFDVWCEWSARSPKYTLQANRKLWAWWDANAGCARHLHIESVFHWAYEAGWKGREPDAVPVEAVQLAKPKTQTPPDPVLSMPGVLGEFARWVNATAVRPQPAFAVGAALCLGSVVAARKYRTTRRNLSSIYVVHVGPSGCGKEHARHAICKALDAADWGSRIGPPSYSSDSGVISALFQAPAHLSIQDEIGAMLGNLKSDAAHHGRSAQRQLIELFGMLDGTARPKAYSHNGLRQDQIDATKRVVQCPAVSMLGMTTPRTLYKAMTEESIEGGFLGRLIVITTDIGRMMPRAPSDEPVPASVVDWINAVRNVGGGNLARVEPLAGEMPALISVPICQSAQEIFDRYTRETMHSADALEDEGMAELEVRSVEKAMRIALILAVARDPVAPVVIEEDAEWAVQFIAHWTARTVSDVRTHMHGSEFASWQAEVLRVIKRGSAKGRTEAELPRYSRTWTGLDLRQRKTVLDALSSGGLIALVEMKTGGRARKAWVATEPQE